MTSYIQRKFPKGLLENKMNSSKTWWDNYRETVKLNKRFRELVSLVGDREDIARNMLTSAKKQYPNRAEIWYFDRLIKELKTRETVNFAY